MENNKVFTVDNITGFILIILVMLFINIRANTISKDDEKLRHGLISGVASL